MAYAGSWIPACAGMTVMGPGYAGSWIPAYAGMTGRAGGLGA